MKISPPQLQNKITAADQGCRGALVYGPDPGLVAETIKAAITAIAGAPADAFLLTELTAAQLKADPALLADEMQALPMLGERKIIVVRQAVDGIVPPVTEVLAAPGQNFLVLEAGALGSKSKLRKAFEGAKAAAAVACYADDPRNLDHIVQDALSRPGVSIAPDARAELVARLGNNRLISRAEVEKLALFAGDGGHLTAQDVRAMVGDNVALALDDVVFDAADGDTPGADRAVARALADGAGAVRILRVLQQHFQRLHQVIGAVQAGARPDAAMKRLWPPVFFKYKSRFQRQCQVWTIEQLGKAMSLLTEAERQCKQTGMPAAAICQRTVLRLSGAARKQGRR